ncbi:hypothetical protein [Streptomyces sp. NPDC002559]
MGNRPAARHQSEKEKEPRPDVEFRARGFHVRVDKVPRKALTALALVGAAVAARLAGIHFWML